MSLDLDKNTWKRVAFGDVVRNVNNTTKDLSVSGIERVIAMEHMDPGELQISWWGGAADGTTFTRLVAPGQTLFGKRRAYQRKVAFAEFEAVCSGDIYTFEAVQDALLPELLPFLVQSDEFFEHALGTSAGSLSPRTNWRDLSNFEFNLPSLDEQQRIADLLWSVEKHHRELLNQRLALLASRAVWLQEELTSGEWESRTINDLVLSGPTNGKSSRGNDEGRGVPTLSISAIRDGRVLGGSSVKYMDVDPDTVKRFVLADDDFLIVRGNGNRSLTGLGGLVRGGLPEGCVYPDLLIRLRFNSSEILPEFACAQWNSSEQHSRLLRKAKSTNGIWKINGKDIKSHSLVVPTIPEQQVVVERIQRLDRAVLLVEKEISTLVELRVSLLNEIFGG